LVFHNFYKSLVWLISNPQNSDTALPGVIPDFSQAKKIIHKE